MFALLAQRAAGRWYRTGSRDYDSDRFIDFPGTRQHYYTTDTEDVLPPPGCIEGLGHTPQLGLVLSTIRRFQNIRNA